MSRYLPLLPTELWLTRRQLAGYDKPAYPPGFDVVEGGVPGDARMALAGTKRKVPEQQARFAGDRAARSR